MYNSKALSRFFSYFSIDTILILLILKGFRLFAFSLYLYLTQNTTISEPCAVMSCPPLQTRFLSSLLFSSPITINYCRLTLEKRSLEFYSFSSHIYISTLLFTLNDHWLRVNQHQQYTKYKKNPTRREEKKKERKRMKKCRRSV